MLFLSHSHQGDSKNCACAKAILYPEKMLGSVVARRVACAGTASASGGVGSALASRSTGRAWQLGRARQMGGGGRPDAAGRLFGEKPLPPGQKRAWEDWEIMYNGAIWGGFLFVGIGLWYKPQTDIRSWARDEALVRELLTDAGEVLELGRNYSQEMHGNVWTKLDGDKPRRGITPGDDEDEDE